jgi:uncharacterized protein (UPF0335 family)
MRVLDFNITESDVGRGLAESGAKTMKTNSQYNNGGPSPLDKGQQSRSDAPTGSGLCDLFQRFLALEEEGKALNNYKAELFATAKADGFDPKALRTAFRQRVREIENPGDTAKYGKLTDSYLVILRSQGKGDAGSSCASPVSPAPAEPALEALTRSHAHTRTRTREPVLHDTDGAVISLADTKDVRVDSSDMDVGADDEPDIPVFLRCSQGQAGPISETKPQTVVRE